MIKLKSLSSLLVRGFKRIACRHRYTTYEGGYYYECHKCGRGSWLV